MKKYLAASVFLLSISATGAYSQTKIEKFCQVIVRQKAFSSKRSTAISFGDQGPLFSFKDSTVTKALLKVNEMTSEPDVLNYMSSIGWKFVSFQFPGQYATYGTFYFKKEFDKSELAE